MGILSADVSDYSVLMVQDEEATIRTLAQCRRHISRSVPRNRGRIVDFRGDDFLAEFPSALDAVRSAIEIQRTLAGQNSRLPPLRRMLFRMGVHLADVRVEGGSIFGEGINLVSRIQELAVPGGVCISAAVYEQIRHKLELPFEDLGEHQLKHIPDPVHLYRSSALTPVAEPRATGEPAEAPLVLGSGRGPAIAVLPFDNLSGDPHQEYLADAVVEDLITRLSRWRLFPVIARNSSFVFRGRPVDVRQVGDELGVRYVVEGSVQRSGERLRITAQLINAESGHHVWGNSYDVQRSDLFAIQDEITNAIVAAMCPALWRSEEQRAMRTEPANMDAWETAQRGWWYWNHPTQADNEKARAHFERAVELDPGFVLAYFGLATTHHFDVLFQSTGSPLHSLQELERLSRRCIELDPGDPFAQLARGLAHSLHRERDDMLRALGKAIELNPSLWMAYRWLGFGLAEVGRTDEAIETLEYGMQLSPQMEWAFLSNIGLAHLHARRYDTAIDCSKRSLLGRPDFVVPLGVLAVSCAHLGRVDEARAAVAEIRRYQPRFSPPALRVVLSCADDEFVEHVLEGFRIAEQSR